MVVQSSVIWVSEKPSSSYSVMLYFWWGCRVNLKLITLGRERVELQVTCCSKTLILTSSGSFSHSECASFEVPVFAHPSSAKSPATAWGREGRILKKHKARISSFIILIRKWLIHELIPRVVHLRTFPTPTYFLCTKLKRKQEIWARFFGLKLGFVLIKFGQRQWKAKKGSDLTVVSELPFVRFVGWHGAWSDRPIDRDGQ